MFGWFFFFPPTCTHIAGSYFEKVYEMDEGREIQGPLRKQRKNCINDVVNSTCLSCHLLTRWVVPPCTCLPVTAPSPLLRVGSWPSVGLLSRARMCMWDVWYPSMCWAGASGGGIRCKIICCLIPAAALMTLGDADCLLIKAERVNPVAVQ